MIPREILKRIRQIELGTNRLVNGVLLALLFSLCSCATSLRQDSTMPDVELPPEVPINKEAGRGGHLEIVLHLESGEEIPMVVDTGAPVTVLDKSMERKLGKRRDTAHISLAGSRWEEGGIFKAPKLYLGKVGLRTGPIIATHDFKRQPMGILGMDCLRHYTIQFDFQAGKMRFLKPDELNTNALGNAFTFFFKNNYPVLSSSGLFGSDTNLLIDLGCNVDGAFDGGTNKWMGVFLPECTWGGESYTNLTVGFLKGANLIGLSFLARHLVTIDFPRKTMYLKQTSVGPLAQDGQCSAAESTRRSALRFLRGMKEAGRLPGWQEDAKQPIFFDQQPPDGGNLVTCKLWARVAEARNCYQLSRDSGDADWKLVGAWRSDENDNKLEEFPIP
jgi:hypothetical protein